jgi:hypothetical protein
MPIERIQITDREQWTCDVQRGRSQIFRNLGHGLADAHGTGAEIAAGQIGDDAQVPDAGGDVLTRERAEC